MPYINQEQEAWLRSLPGAGPSDPGVSLFVREGKVAHHLPDWHPQKQAAFAQLEKGEGPGGIYRGGLVLDIFDGDVTYAITDARLLYGIRQPAAPLQAKEGNDFWAAAWRVFLAEVFVFSKDLKTRFVYPCPSWGSYSEPSLHNDLLDFTVKEVVTVGNAELSDWFFREENRAAEKHLHWNLTDLTDYSICMIDRWGKTLAGQPVIMLNGYEWVGVVNGLDGPVFFEDLDWHTSLDHVLQSR